MNIALLTLLGLLLLQFVLGVTSLCLDTLPVNERIKKAIDKKIYYAIPSIFVAIALNLLVIFIFMLKESL